MTTSWPFVPKDIVFHTKPIDHVTWNSDGTHIGAACADKCARIGHLDLATGNVGYEI